LEENFAVATETEGSIDEIVVGITVLVGSSVELMEGSEVGDSDGI